MEEKLQIKIEEIKKHLEESYNEKIEEINKHGIKIKDLLKEIKILKEHLKEVQRKVVRNWNLKVI